jgi:hypothetical protein
LQRLIAFSNCYRQITVWIAIVSVKTVNDRGKQKVGARWDRKYR